MNTYQKGALVRISFDFKNSDGDPIDPGVVKITIKDPAGVTTTYTYGTDSQLVKDSTGNYHLDQSAAHSGEYLYKTFSTGIGQAAAKGSFNVAQDDF